MLEVLVEMMGGPGTVQMGWPGGSNGGHFDFLDFGLLQAFGFGASVLEPDFDLKSDKGELLVFLKVNFCSKQTFSRNSESK